MSAAEHDELTQARETKERAQAQQAQQAQQQAEQAEQAQQQAEQAQQVLDNEAWEAAALAEASENAPDSPRLRKNRVRRDSKVTIPDSLRAQIDTPNTCRRVVNVPWPSLQPICPLAATEARHSLARGRPPVARGACSGAALGLHLYRISRLYLAYISPCLPPAARGGPRCSGRHWGRGGILVACPSGRVTPVLSAPVLTAPPWPRRYRRECQFPTRDPSPTPDAREQAAASDAAAADDDDDDDDAADAAADAADAAADTVPADADADASAAATAAAAPAATTPQRPPLTSVHGSLAASIQDAMLRRSPAGSSSPGSKGASGSSRQLL